MKNEKRYLYQKIAIIMLTITFVIQVHAVPFRFQILAAITDDKKDKKIPWKPITVEFERIIYKHCGIKKSHVWFDGHFLLKVYQFQNKEEDKDNKWGEAINLCKPKFSLKDEIWSKLLPKGTKGVTFKYKCIQNNPIEVDGTTTDFNPEIERDHMKVKDGDSFDLDCTTYGD